MKIGKMVSALVVIGFVTATLLIPFQPAIVFEYENTNRLLAYLFLRGENTFQIQYTHSIHKSDVTESYRVNGETIQLYELEYEDFAVGLPANAEAGETFRVRDGKYLIDDMDRRFRYIDLRVGQVRANHRIIWHGKRYDLRDSLQPGTWVRIKIKKLNLLERMRGVKLHESRG